MLLPLLLVAALQVASASGTPPATVRIGGLFPLSDPVNGGAANCWRAAANLAVQAINNATSILPHTDVELNIVDDAGTPGRSMTATMDLLCQVGRAGCEPVHMLLGPAISANAEASQAVAQLYNISQVSAVASDPALSNKAQYPTFSRTQSPVQLEGSALAAFVHRYTKWSYISVLYGSSANDLATAQAFVGSLPINITVTAMQRFLKPDPRVSTANAEQTELLARLEFLKTAGSYIIALFLDSTDVQLLFQTLQKLNMVGPPWAYITTSSVMTELGAYPSLYSAFQGVVGVYSVNPSNQNSVYEEFLKLWRAHPIPTCADGANPDTLSAQTYDTVWFMATAYDAAIRAAGDQSPSNELVLKKIRSTRIAGVTGPIVLDGSGDRLPYLGVGYIPVATSSEAHLRPVQVGLYAGNGALTVAVAEIVWPGGGRTVPNDRPQPFQPSQVLLDVCRALVALTALITLAHLIGVIIYRKAKLIQWSSPAFLFCICIGALISTVAGVLLVVDIPLTPLLCSAFTWMDVLGTVGVLGTLFSKTHRIYRIFSDVRLQRVVIKDSEVALRICGLLLGAVGLLVAWQIVAPPVVKLGQTDPADNGEIFYYQQCDTTTGTATVAFVLTYEVAVVALMLWGAYLAYKTRKVPAGFNESRLIGMAIYNGLLVALLTSGLRILVQTIPDALLLVSFVRVLQPTVFTVVVIMAPKLWMAAHGQETDTMTARQPLTTDERQKLRIAQSEVVTLKKRVGELEREVATLSAPPPAAAPSGSRRSNNINNPLLGFGSASARALSLSSNSRRGNALRAAQSPTHQPADESGVEIPPV